MSYLFKQLDLSFQHQITQRIAQKTKPLGSLGQLESLAYQLALIQSQGKKHAVDTIILNTPSVVVFAGDHGIADEGVSIAPSAVTHQMVMNFLSGGAAINCFCRANDVQIMVVDCGILLPIETEHSHLVVQRLGERTQNFVQQAAMTPQQVEQGLEYGQQLVMKVIHAGSNLVMFGEMGIANTSSAAALLAALSGLPSETCVGMGTGISPEQFEKKQMLIDQSVLRCQTVMGDQKRDPKQTLAQLGGFEIVQMVGGFLAAAQHNTPVIVDGFIATVAAYVATLLNPSCRDYMIFAHRSHESGHQAVLQLLEAKPLLDLGLRLGEGTGAVLAVPLLRAAAEFYNTMASFEQAGVTV
ncbi:nicotinate-nucleotide--dimethylbenzimidazole phosphoribosyltransferase [Vibrio sp. V27_P1S3P104]|uniref:nicotinate-nucleotide--dimethylbenzimidazole phosphoribosyltransferase n=1 Tax=unclassified Vibrio TaxID=2614977 RepID=UPI001372569C|nr:MULTISPECIES: nicotinate-nucleotide--dimethylbenzimidazole phosphoribosyltransferase [unclassified Vibrio]NAW69268.1 nicotinate-nucleotide--dimethylbenzimidazole phosphoribosyltransferase [Vibrio sp. V28_P6S34P95]NAX05207.1 nicotinate-nucleotide--dimethylbenzimidazole phosphoribosyltransferase [Vibrio sp. V30_P3S12P165]NAX35427.1 nicotinate-nucleotide--dimethylbenzimidazole phosphoribosyltransferase [Vibrio sp. V29_P1S30P107]NAX37083.1 nicotinate-nucleotide--dimethylbenzimidazole phosphoribo